MLKKDVTRYTAESTIIDNDHTMVENQIDEVEEGQYWTRRKKGLIFGVLSGITWGLDTVLLNQAYNYKPLTGEWSTFTTGAVPNMIHDLLCSIILIIFLCLFCYFKEIKHAFTQKGLLWMSLASVMGGPVGMLGYLLAISYIGAGYTAAISALCPAVGATLATLLLGDKMFTIGWVGLFFAILGTAGSSLSAILTAEETATNADIGVMFAIMCVIGWGVECVIADYSFRYYSMNSFVALFIRQFVSAVVYNVIVFPATNINHIEVLREMWESEALPWIVAAACSGTFSLSCYYATILNLGATQAIAMNITYAIWTIIIGFAFSIVPDYLWIIAICILFICMGSFMCSGLGKEPRPGILIKSWFGCATREELQDMHIAQQEYNSLLDKKRKQEAAGKGGCCSKKPADDETTTTSATTTTSTTTRDHDDNLQSYQESTHSLNI